MERVCCSTLWFIFIGHGYATKADGPLLVAVDAQQKLSTLSARSIAREGLRKLLETTKGERVVMLVDACFSGKTGSNSELLPGLQPIIPDIEPVRSEKTVVLTAAGAGEVAGPLPGAARPAFSLLALGALRGWADTNNDGKVTGAEIRDFTARVLGNLRDRKQIPTAEGAIEASLSSTKIEPKPDLPLLMAQFGFGEMRSIASPPSHDAGDAPPWYKRKRAWGWVGIGVGAAVALSGIYYTSQAFSLYDKGLMATEQDRTNLNDAKLKSAILYGAGGAIAATGFILAIIGDKVPAKATVGFRLVPSGLGLALVKRF